MDPVFDTDGNPYGPTRYRELIKERYLISKNCNTSYNDVGEMTPTERTYILQLIAEEIKKSDALIASIKESKQRR